jgi:hypothetical protein
VADGDVAPHAPWLFPIGRAGNFMNDLAVTSHTVGLQGLSIFFIDHDGFFKVLQGKGLRVVPAIFGFGKVLSQKSLRQMAIHTGCYIVVTCL